MEIERIVYLIILFVLIIFSALFSGSEVALFGLEKKKINIFFSNNKVIQRYLNNLLSYPRKLLVSILIGNNLVNVAISIISVLIVTDLSFHYDLDLNLMISLQIITISTLILIFGELVPKMIATKYQIPLLKIITIPLYFFTVIINPISEIISELIHFATSKFKYDKNKFAIDSQDFADISQLTDGKINLNQSEKEILESLSEFKEILVSEIMTPRVDIVALSLKDDVDKAFEVITNSGHSRIPVFEETIDNIVGILHAKDLLKFNINPKLKSETSLKSLIKKPLFVPEAKKINDLLTEFQLKKNHIAIVVDEYGGTSGLITLEDIIEEVLGDIWDEFDKSELAINEVSSNTFIVNPKLTFSEFESEIKREITLAEEIKDNSIASVILDLSGEIPIEGHSLKLSNMKMTILEVLNKRIKKVKIELLNN